MALYSWTLNNRINRWHYMVDPLITELIDCIIVEPLITELIDCNIQ